MRTAGVARERHAELAGGIRGQEIPLQATARHHLAGFGAHPFVVERRTAHGAEDMRVFSHVDVIGQHLLAQRVEQKAGRSEEHTSELQSLMRISYAVFCLNKKKTQYNYYS